MHVFFFRFGYFILANANANANACAAVVLNQIGKNWQMRNKLAWLDKHSTSTRQDLQDFWACGGASINPIHALSFLLQPSLKEILLKPLASRCLILFPPLPQFKNGREIPGKKQTSAHNPRAVLLHDLVVPCFPF